MGHFCVNAVGTASSAGSLRPRAPATVKGTISGTAASAVIRSVPSVPLISHRNPVPPATASLMWMLALARGREGADQLDLVSRRFHGLLASLF